MLTAHINAFTGKVTDSQSKETLTGVNVFIKELSKGTVTDENGVFTFSSLPEGTYIIDFSFIGYTPVQKTITIPYAGESPFLVELSPGLYDLHEVVVTTSPAGTGFRYQANQAFTGEKLERMQAVSLGTMLDGQPGVASHSLGPAPTRPVLRGLDGERVLMLENGERMGDLSATAHDHVVSLEPLATQRIEIVRGPAGLLFGSSAIGGVVNLITDDIPQKWKKGPSGNLHGQYATVNQMYAGMAAFTQGWNNAAVTGRISYRHSGELQTPDGILPGTEIQNLDASAGFGFKRGNSGGGASFQAVDMTYGIPESVDDPDEKVEIRLNKQTVQTLLHHERDGFFDKFEWRVNAGRFFQQEIEIEFESDGTSDEEVELEFLQHSFSTTLSTQHRPFSIFDRGAIGLNIYGRNLDVGGDDAFTPGYQTLNFAFYTFEEVPLSRKVRLQGGFRLDYSLNTTIANPQFPVIDEQNNYFNYSVSLGVNYKPRHNIEMGAQLARAFRNPSLEELYADGPHIGAGVYEIGDVNMKSETAYGADVFALWKNRIFSIEAAGFVNRIENFISFSPTGEIDSLSGLPVFVYGQAAAMLMGGELSTTVKILPSLTATAVMDYVHGTFIDQQHTPLPFMPPYRLSTNLTYEHKSFWVGGGSRYVAAQNRVAPDESSTDGYWLLGLDVGYRLDFHGEHLFMARVQNLLNKSYRDHLSRVFERDNPMPGRNFQFSYRYKF